MVYSVSANSMFSIDENGVHSLEVSYHNSDGIDVGAYAKGDNFDKVLGDVLDQIEEGIAEADDARADAEEVVKLQAQIDDLTAQLEELKARNKIQQKNISTNNYKKMQKNVDHITQEYNLDDLMKRWFK